MDKLIYLYSIFIKNKLIYLYSIIRRNKNFINFLSFTFLSLSFHNINLILIIFL